MEKWVTNYPELSAVATSLFALPASSYFSERIFSAAGKILEQCQENSDGELVDDIIFIRNF